MKVAVAFEGLISIHTKSVAVRLFLIFYLISIIVFRENINSGIAGDEVSKLERRSRSR